MNSEAEGGTRARSLSLRPEQSILPSPFPLLLFNSSVAIFSLLLLLKELANSTPAKAKMAPEMHFTFFHEAPLTRANEGGTHSIIRKVRPANLLDGFGDSAAFVPQLQLLETKKFCLFYIVLTRLA